MFATSTRTLRTCLALGVSTTIALAPMTSPTLAGPNAGAYLVLHVAEATAPDPCMHTGTVIGCQSIQNSTVATGVPMVVYVLAERTNVTAGVGGARFGIQYSPLVQVQSWTSCADQQSLAGWPATGSGLTVSWDVGSCQRRQTSDGWPFIDTGAAVVGYFYCSAYGPSNMAIYPHPGDVAARLTDCSGVADNLANIPSALGWAGFGGAAGYSPCANPHVLACSISGPLTIPANSGGHVFTASPGGGDGSEWTVVGEATISGPANQASVSITTGGPGEIRVRHRSPGPVEQYFCEQVVTVEGAVTVTPGSWSRIKSVVVR